MSLKFASSPRSSVCNVEVSPAEVSVVEVEEAFRENRGLQGIHNF